MAISPRWRSTKLLFSIACLAFLGGCANTVRVQPVDDEMVNLSNGGVFYSLPKTVFVVATEVKMAVTTSAKKDYAVYTKSLFSQPIPSSTDPGEMGKSGGKWDAKTKTFSKKSFSLIKASLTSAGMADRKNTYFIRVKQSPFSSQNNSFTLNSEGILTSGQSEAKNLTLDYVVSTLEVAGKTAATLYGLPISHKASSIENIPLRTKLEIFKGRLEREEKNKDILTKELKEARLEAKDLEGKDLEEMTKQQEEKAERLEKSRERINELKDEIKEVEDQIVESLQQPQLPPEIQKDYNRIRELRKMRDQLLVGTSPQSPAMLKELDKELNALLAKFFGTTAEKTAVLNIRIEPPLVMGESVPPPSQIFFLSKKGEVVVGGTLLNALPKFLRKIPESCGNTAATLSLSVTPSRPAAEKGVRKLTEAVKKKKEAEQGLFYRIPGRAELRLRRKTFANGKPVVKTLAYAEPLVAQYGVVSFLPYTTKSQRTKISATLNPATGALVTVGIGGDPVDPALIGRAGGAANTALEGYVGRETKKADQSDELAASNRKKALLENEAAILELEKKIKDLRPPSSEGSE